MYFRKVIKQTAGFLVSHGEISYFISNVEKRTERHRILSLPLLFSVKAFPVLEFSSWWLCKLYFAQMAYEKELLYLLGTLVSQFMLNFFCLGNSCSHAKLYFKLQNRKEKHELFFWKISVFYFFNYGQISKILYIWNMEVHMKSKWKGFIIWCL